MTTECETRTEEEKIKEDLRKLKLHIVNEGGEVMEPFEYTSEGNTFSLEGKRQDNDGEGRNVSVMIQVTDGVSNVAFDILIDNGNYGRLSFSDDEGTECQIGIPPQVTEVMLAWLSGKGKLDPAFHYEATTNVQ